jgi:hypothetical protein
MRSNRMGLSVFLALAVPLLALSCGSAASPSAGLVAIASISGQTAESVTFRVGVKNTGAKTQTLIFGSSQFFDIEVRSLTGKLLWRFSEGKLFLDVLWGLALEPGQSSVQEAAWDFAAGGEAPLFPGPCTAIVTITSFPRREGLTTSIRLRVPE